MKEVMYKKYANQKPIAVTHISNTLGVRIYEPDESDKYNCDFICSWYNGENEWGFHRHNVHYSISGRPFIRKGSLRIYLDEVIRIA